MRENPLESTWGSSPLARGLLGFPVGDRISEGIIPARAGFTGPYVQDSAPNRDHPRSRGVYPLDPRAAAFIAGSSPLARGLRRRVGDTHGGARIIPARAGFTCHVLTALKAPTDHPRSRGVY